MNCKVHKLETLFLEVGRAGKKVLSSKKPKGIRDLPNHIFKGTDYKKTMLTQIKKVE